MTAASCYKRKGEQAEAIAAAAAGMS